MALELRQQLKLTQQLVMTPQLQQAIGLLQLSRLELLEKVQQELLENPFLEEADGDGEMESTLDSALELRDDVGSDDNNYDLEVAKNGDWEDYLGDLSSTPRQSQIREVELPDDDGLSFESRYAAKPSLASHLLWQLRLSKLSEEQKSIGECIVGNLNSMGYLEASDEEVAEMTGTSVEEVRAVARQIQRFDPVGVACRTPQECLLTQIEFLGYDRDPVLVEMVRDHLEDLESRRYKPLLRKFRLTLEDLEEYLNLISTLNPMPGASFGGDDPFYVSPDVFVYKYEGDFVIILNDDDLPQLHVSSAYEFCLDGASDKDKEYLNEKKRAAEWLKARVGRVVDARRGLGGLLLSLGQGRVALVVGNVVGGLALVQRLIGQGRFGLGRRHALGRAAGGQREAGGRHQAADVQDARALQPAHGVCL